MVKPSSHAHLSRRERQIMDVIYHLGKAGVAEVLERLPDPPSYSAVRAMLRILEEKGHLRHEQDGARYVYLATLPHGMARESALKHLLRTFFNNSTETAVAALLDLKGDELSERELDRLSVLIDQARQTGEDS